LLLFIELFQPTTALPVLQPGNLGGRLKSGDHDVKILKLTATLVLGLAVLLNLFAIWQAHGLVTHPMSSRRTVDKTPADFGLDYRDVQVTSSDGFTLSGWLIESRNGAVILMQHGYKWDRMGHLEEAVMLSRAGYGVLVMSVRSHDVNAGETITFGVEEMKDLDAWYRFTRQLPDINPGRIGMLGDSLGGSLVIQYAAANNGIAAVVAHSAFSSLQDTIETSIRHFTGLPPFPFAPMIRFWAERETGIDIGTIDTKRWIGEISPRPVLIIHSLDDDVISTSSGERLFEAAGEPRELWLEHGIGHADFDSALPEEFERRIVKFFDAALLEAGRLKEQIP
jgi:fermentation-respiration switch protein FrsA (DUF1100 family)